MIARLKICQHHPKMLFTNLHKKLLIVKSNPDCFYHSQYSNRFKKKKSINYSDEFPHLYNFHVFDLYKFSSNQIENLTIYINQKHENYKDDNNCLNNLWIDIIK